jgi:hypothetical protein
MAVRAHLRALAMLVAVGVPVLLAAAPAYASCALPPRVSAHPFTGTVVSVSNAGRTASVRTDDGRIVVVHGSEADQPGAFSSVDRTYEVGARYEFHPINDADPYQDNVCTATHPILASASARPAGPATPSRADGDPAGGSGVGWIAAGAVALVTVVGLWLLKRRRPDVS